MLNSLGYIISYQSIHGNVIIYEADDSLVLEQLQGLLHWAIICRIGPVRARNIRNIPLTRLPKFCIFQHIMYMIKEKTLPKSTCLTGSFTCPKPSGSRIRQALPSASEIIMMDMGKMSRYCIVLYCISLNCIVFVLYCTIIYGRIELYFTLPRYTKLHRIASYSQKGNYGFFLL